MTDDLEPIRRLRPDRMLAPDAADPEVLTEGRRRLLASITGAGTDGTPEFPSIYPRLAYRDEVAALEFLVRAFGFVERREARMEHPAGMLAWLQLGDGLVMIGRAGPDHHGLVSPVEGGGPTAMVMVRIDDVDDHHRRAVAEGARIVTPPEDTFWGDRRYEALDPDDHRWHFAARR